MERQRQINESVLERKNKLSTEEFSGLQAYHRHNPGLTEPSTQNKTKDLNYPKQDFTQQKQMDDLTTTGCTLGECRASPAARAPRNGGAGRWWRSEGSEPHRWSGHKSAQQSPPCQGRQMRITHTAQCRCFRIGCLALVRVTTLAKVIKQISLKQILKTVDKYCSNPQGLKFVFPEMPPSSLTPECRWLPTSLPDSASIIVFCHSQLPRWEGLSVATLVGDCSTLLFSVLLFLLLCLLWVSLFYSTCCLLLWCAASSPSCARVSSGRPSVRLHKNKSTYVSKAIKSRQYLNNFHVYTDK